MSIQFILPEIDRANTRKAVEEALEKYRIASLSIQVDLLPQVTQKFSLIPASYTGLNHSSTENTALKNIESEYQEVQRNRYMDFIMRSVNRLSMAERQIIIKRYIQDEEMYDYEVYNDLGMSESKYYRLKSRAFYKLAFAMKIEVYGPTEQVVSS
ncbi:ArpU family phage packaging/lysis transcriptional regulator [Jeotgalibacillus proteolyticus]